MQPGKSGQAECSGHTDTPDETAVKQEGDQCLTAGTQSEVSGIGIGIEGHCQRIDAD